MAHTDTRIAGDKMQSLEEKLKSFHIKRTIEEEMAKESADLQNQANVRPAYKARTGVAGRSVRISTFDKEKNRWVHCGYFKDRVFRRKVKPIHRMYTTNCYAIQEETFQMLVKRGCRYIIFEQRGKMDLVSKIEDWLKPDIQVMELKEHGVQRHFPIDRMIPMVRGHEIT